MSDLPGDSYWAVENEVLAGPYPGAAKDADAESKLSALLDLGVGLFLDLTEEAEGPPLRPYAPRLRALAADRGQPVTYARMAIQDVSVPSDWQMRAILATIGAARAAGQGVYVHCWGGIGRTGTVIGCLMRDAGCPAGDVLDRIAAARGGLERAHRESPETAEQRAFVTEWLEARTAQSTRSDA